MLPSIFVGDSDTYPHIPFISHEFDIKHCDYFQSVNQCEIQQEHGTFLVFKDVKDTKLWLSKKQAVSTIIAHCG